MTSRRAEMAVRAGRLLDPAGRSQGVRLVLDANELTGYPVGYPRWWLVLLLVPVAAGFVATVGYEWDRLIASPLGLLVAGVMLAGSPVVWLGLLEVVAWRNRKMTTVGPFFVADAAGRWLSLPRAGVRVERADIVGFIEVRAFHTVADAEGSSSDWLGEITVLAAGPGGEPVRHPVLTAARTDQVRRAGRQLAELYGVGLRQSRATPIGWWGRPRGRDGSAVDAVTPEERSL